MADYSSIVNEMKRCYGLRVRRWRRSMTGCAWRVLYQAGNAMNWIEGPYTRRPISLSIFLREVGPHVIGFDRYRRRCDEEYHAWQWALAEMRRQGVEPDARVLRRYDLSMRYAVDKAMRRGARQFAEPLLAFLPLAA